ncbi:MAG: transcriptional repressor NrdR [Actinomycetia bacterium]|nr:transcriptional repressor NrdR [Actinomycetes bacterium]MCP4226375.1 transcriptional repressor NrdR [Actinomycetes bacterium]MCP5030195.1 transcriptional repressor NrdR [Actinomycetes bacterium]
MRCPACGNDDTKVVDSRSVDEGAVTRRRRSCERCAGRFTTFERAEIAALVVVKRSGERQPFDGQKILKGLASAAKGVAVDTDDLELLVDRVEEQARIEGPEVTSEWVGLAVLDRLRSVDQVACLRFASVYKGFTDIGDFEREVRLIKRESV